MKVKVFEGTSLNSVIQQIKSEFGDGYTVLYQDVIKEKTFIPFIKKKKYVLVVEKREDQDGEKIGEFDEEILESTNYDADLTPSRTNKKSEFEDVLKDQIEENKSERNVESRMFITHYDNLSEDIFREFTGKSLDLIRLLIDKDVDITVAKEVVRHACGFEMDSNKLDLKHYTFRESLIEGVEKIIDFAGDILEKDLEKGKRSIYAFLGPTGVGKTTNLFKFASRLVLDKGKKVGVISTDTFKAGAGEQIRGYTNILKIPYGIFSDPKKLRETLDDWSDLDFILIDTIGRSHYDHWKIGEIKEILKYAQEVEYILTLSCNMNNKEMYNIIERFGKFFNLKYVLFTKIDETFYPGALLNVPVKTGLKLTYISTGQNVPEDIKILTPERLVSYLLMDR